MPSCTRGWSSSPALRTGRTLESTFGSSSALRYTCTVCMCVQYYTVCTYSTIINVCIFRITSFCFLAMVVEFSGSLVSCNNTNGFVV